MRDEQKAAAGRGTCKVAWQVERKVMRIAALIVGGIGAAAGVARADRVPVAVLVLDSKAETAAAIDEALAQSKDARPLDDPATRQLLVTGGPASQVADLLARGKERFAALNGAEADAALAEAEAIALRDLRRVEACPRLAEIDSLRLKYAEMIKDDAAAAHAALLLGACVPQPNPDDAAAIARHAPPLIALLPAQEVRIESDPTGADVYVDLRAVGKTPLVLPTDRRPEAIVDVELEGFRKVHRVAPAPGTLAVALSRDEGLVGAVDRARLSGADPPENLLADLGRRLGAARVLVVKSLPGEPAQIQAHLLEVASASWSQSPLIVPAAPASDGTTAAVKLGAYAAKAPSGVKLTLGTSKDKNFEAPLTTAKDKLSGKPTEKVPAWKRWYTWVIGGALLVGIGAVLIADHVGSDQVTVHVAR